MTSPSVTTQSGLKAEVDVTRDFPYVTKYHKNKDGTTVPSNFHTRKVGTQIEALPTFAADGQTIGLKFRCEITTFEGWIDYPHGVRQPVFNAKSIDTQKLFRGHTYAWVGPTPSDKSPTLIALIIIAHPVKDTASASVSKMPPKVSEPKPAVRFHISFVEIDEKAYEQQAQAMDEAVKKGDVHFFYNSPWFVRTTDIFLLVGQSGWYSEGEAISYIGPVSSLKKEGAFLPNLNGKAVFIGLNTAITWSNNGKSLNSAWSVTMPVGFDTENLSPDITTPNVPNPYLAPRFHVTTFTDKDWDMAPGQRHGFWVGESYGWAKSMGQFGGIKPKSQSPYDISVADWESLIKSHSATRLAVFMSAQPLNN